MNVIYDVLRLFIQLLTPFVKILADITLLCLTKPVTFWVVMILVLLALGAVYGLTILAFKAIVKVLNVDHAQPYSALWNLRNARDYLDSAISELVFTPSHYVPILVGKVIVMRFVPDDFPDGNDAKVCIQAAISKLDKKKADPSNLSELERIERSLPDMQDVAVFNGKAVDNNTFAQERGFLYQTVEDLKKEIRHVEQLLPWGYITMEKLTLYIKVLLELLIALWVVCALSAVTVQVCVYGMNLLLTGKLPFIQ